MFKKYSFDEDQELKRFIEIPLEKNLDSIGEV